MKQNQNKISLKAERVRQFCDRKSCISAASWTVRPTDILTSTLPISFHIDRTWFYFDLQRSHRRKQLPICNYTRHWSLRPWNNAAVGFLVLKSELTSLSFAHFSGCSFRPVENGSFFVQKGFFSFCTKETGDVNWIRSINTHSIFQTFFRPKVIQLQTGLWPMCSICELLRFVQTFSLFLSFLQTMSNFLKKSPIGALASAIENLPVYESSTSRSNCNFAHNFPGKEIENGWLDTNFSTFKLGTGQRIIQEIKLDSVNPQKSQSLSRRPRNYRWMTCFRKS